MSTEHEVTVVRSWASSWINTGVVLAGIGMHVALVVLFGDKYLTALWQSVVGAGQLLLFFWTKVRACYEWCFKFTGWFFFPLAFCVGHSAWTLWTFVQADRQGQPLPEAECERRYDTAVYIGIDQAALIGFAGTIIYIIIGLGLMAEAMMAMASAIGGGAMAKGGVANLPFKQLAQAALFLVPALGTTFVPLISEAMVNHVGRIMQRWHGGAKPKVANRNNPKQLPLPLAQVKRPGKAVVRLATEIVKAREAGNEA